MVGFHLAQFGVSFVFCFRLRRFYSFSFLCVASGGWDPLKHLCDNQTKELIKNSRTSKMQNLNQSFIASKTENLEIKRSKLEVACFFFDSGALIGVSPSVT